MLNRIGVSRRFASANASGPHSHQWTGLSAYWSKYGEVADARRLDTLPTLAGWSSTALGKASDTRSGSGVIHEDRRHWSPVARDHSAPDLSLTTSAGRRRDGRAATHASKAAA